MIGQRGVNGRSGGGRRPYSIGEKTGKESLRGRTRDAEMMQPSFLRGVGNGTDAGPNLKKKREFEKNLRKNRRAIVEKNGKKRKKRVRGGVVKTESRFYHAAVTGGEQANNYRKRDLMKKKRMTAHGEEAPRLRNQKRRGTNARSKGERPCPNLETKRGCALALKRALGGRGCRRGRDIFFFPPTKGTKASKTRTSKNRS